MMRYRFRTSKVFEVEDGEKGTLTRKAFYARKTPCPARNSLETPYVHAVAARNTDVAAIARTSIIWWTRTATSLSPFL